MMAAVPQEALLLSVHKPSKLVGKKIMKYSEFLALTIMKGKLLHKVTMNLLYIISKYSFQHSKLEQLTQHPLWQLMHQITQLTLWQLQLGYIFLNIMKSVAHL